MALDTRRKLFDLSRNPDLRNESRRLLAGYAMLGTQRAPMVSVDVFHILEAYAEGMGVDFAAVAMAVDLDLALLKDSEARISGRQFESIWRRVVAEGGDSHPGLHFGQEMGRHFPGGNILFTMMMNCGTVGAALEVFQRYHRIMGDFIQPVLSKARGRVLLSWNRLQPGFDPHPHVSEALLCTFQTILEQLSGGRIRAVEVCFTHAAPADTKEYREIFKAPVRFGAKRNQLVLADHALDLEIRLANRELFKVLERYADRLVTQIGGGKDLTTRVVRLMTDMFAQGKTPDVTSVSRDVAMSRRSLQARLKDEDMTFRACLDLVRKRIALDYLEQPKVTICDLTFLLGYSEQSAFNHAFKRWTGKTPKEYRRLSSLRRR